MNRILALSSLAFLTLCLQAQSPEQLEKMRQAALEKHAQNPGATPKWEPPVPVIATRTPLAFFATYEDMVANKPVEGVTLEARGWFSMLLGKESIVLNENGTQRKAAVQDLPYWGFASDEGVIMRIFDGKVYNCLTLGDKCVYLSKIWYNVSPNLDMSTDSDGHIDTASEGPNAEVIKKKKQVEAWVEAAGMTKEYEAAKPKREMKDSVMGYFAKLMKRDVDFVNRINGDSAVK